MHALRSQCWDSDFSNKYNMLARPPGIEPGPPVCQADALTTTLSAHASRSLITVECYRTATTLVGEKPSRKQGISNTCKLLTKNNGGCSFPKLNV